MRLTCQNCGATFSDRQFIEGSERHLNRRKLCLSCRPFKARRSPRFVTPRPVKQKHCAFCGTLFAAKQLIDGKERSLYRRRFCLNCSPFGSHNTSKRAPGLDPLTRRQERLRRKKAGYLRYQRKRRHTRKRMLIGTRGGRCQDCGYSHSIAALEFHHRNAQEKSFGIGEFTGSTARLMIEAAKCDLVCANCHRMRHVEREAKPVHDIVKARHRLKQRAVDALGGACAGCGGAFHRAAFEFHHRDPRTKEFGVATGGLWRRWERLLPELEKCILLCANCHREVHAGVRELDEGLLGLAEAPATYRISA